MRYWQYYVVDGPPSSNKKCALLILDHYRMSASGEQNEASKDCIKPYTHNMNMKYMAMDKSQNDAYLLPNGCRNAFMIHFLAMTTVYKLKI